MKTNSKFKLFIKTELSSADFKVLSLLYQPLIGHLGYSLYSTFYQLSKVKELEMNHATLMDMLNINQTTLVKELEKLEAFGLIETYSKDNSDFIYFIKPPYSAKKFIVDTFLGRFLESEIGNKNIKILTELFKVDKPSLDNFNNVTKTFDDLYKFKSEGLLKVDYELEDRNGNNTKLLKSSIDYNLFVEKLPRALKSPKLFNDNFKEQILQLAYIYQFSIDDLIGVYTNAHKGRREIDIENLSFQARVMYEELNKDIVVVNKEVSEDDVLEKVSYKFIVDKFVVGDVYAKAHALDTINEFINQNVIEQGTLNVLLIFILKNKQGVLPHVNYLNKVWQAWHKNGVVTASDARRHQKQIESRYNYKTNNKKTEVEKPEWLDKYLDEFDSMEG